MNCINCNKETSNPKFCSKSCAATFNNKVYPKRKLNRTCVICDSPVKSGRHTRCEYHWQEHKENKYKSRTVGEYRNLLSVAGKHPSWINTHIRQFARSWNKELRSGNCQKCGYDKHVELAHIRSVTEFKDDDLLSNVNSPANLLALCPNCHWEFDNLNRDQFKFLLNK